MSWPVFTWEDECQWVSEAQACLRPHLVVGYLRGQSLSQHGRRQVGPAAGGVGQVVASCGTRMERHAHVRRTRPKLSRPKWLFIFLNLNVRGGKKTPISQNHFIWQKNQKQKKSSPNSQQTSRLDDVWRLWECVQTQRAFAWCHKGHPYPVQGEWCCLNVHFIWMRIWIIYIYKGQTYGLVYFNKNYNFRRKKTFIFKGVWWSGSWLFRGVAFWVKKNWEMFIWMRGEAVFFIFPSDCLKCRDSECGHKTHEKRLKKRTMSSFHEL